MGDTKKHRKTYTTPMHPWNAATIEEERGLVKEYGLRNKKEIWKMTSLLTRFKDRAKQLIARRTKQAETEREQLIQRMAKLGLITQNATFDDVLGLKDTDVMNRRLQALLVTKHLARTTRQARQMIIHRHVLVGGKVVTSPSYLVPASEESDITFVATSAFSNQQHPERFSEEELAQKKAKDGKKKNEKKEEDEVLAFDEKAIAEAERLAGETAVKTVENPQ